MSKYLVIVESPAKAKTINKYLGSDYIVKSSIGHIRDLPTGKGTGTKKPLKRLSTKGMTDAQKEKARAKREQEKLVRTMGIDPLKDWVARYEILPGKEKVLDELQKLAKKSERIFLATDLDREGEAIAWHLREAIGGDDDRYQRVTFSEITKKAIQAAFSEPSQLDMNRVNAQQARRFLDRLVGFMLSPLLWKKVARGLSAGRVQSVAAKLVVEREHEIAAFIPEEYWDMFADLNKDGASQFRAQVTKADGKAYRPTSQAESEAAEAILRSAQYRITKRDDKPAKSKPYAPFITSTLQQSASVRMGFGVKKTMMLAQRLYEAGYITYMRTDSTNISADAIASCREYVTKTYGGQYVPENPNIYSSKKNAQEAHEAIRPSDVRVESTDLKGVDADALRLYDLIRNQFIACQMPPAVYDTTSLVIGADKYELRARGRVMRFDGWMKVLPPAKKKGEEDTQLPDLQAGDGLSLETLFPAQHFTKPPARFSEASLVKELEKRGIGRPSTYAAIISTIQDRGYVRIDKKRFYAEKMGDIVTDRLQNNFSELMDYSFTAGMEERLDDVAEGEKVWKDVLNNFYSEFTGDLQAADANMKPNDPTPTSIPCEKCSRTMSIRTGRTGVFLGCSGYAEKGDDKCTATVNLVSGDEAVDIDVDENAEVDALRSKRRCSLCGAAMMSYLVDEGHKLHICDNNPNCSGNEIEEGTFKIKGYEGPIIECDKCGADMELKSGRFGKYFACTKYPDCKNTRKLLRNGEAAPPKADPVPMPELPCEKSESYFILRDGAAGIFLASSIYPKSRETKNPQVADLARHRDELDPKFLYLADAPQEDDEGRSTIIRYSRKTKTQYIMTEADGKPSGWTALYEDGKWIISKKEKKKAATKKKATKKKATAKK